jgi:hypothetical protein
VTRTSETTFASGPFGSDESLISNFEISNREVSPTQEKEQANSESAARFTIDGSAELERLLAEDCQAVLRGVQKIIPASELEALVLGGGYGRSQGGVLRTDSGERPYNDLEFYVFVRGNILMARLRYNGALQALGESLSPGMGLHVEFKLESLEKFRHSTTTMYSYDLVAGHKIVSGDKNLFDGCKHHLIARQIPPSEATRLLFNRCSGLLLVKNLLRGRKLDTEQTDFIGRNLAKAELGLGDAVLTFFGRYHWDCRERHRRLMKLKPSDAPPWLMELRRHHEEGVEFKLHPRRSNNSRAELESHFAELQRLGLKVWLWLETQRLDKQFESARDYALSDVRKCPGSIMFRNCLLNVKSHGLRAFLTPGCFRYPREKLFNALCLLLWDEAVLRDAAMLQRLQKILRAESTCWDDLISAYQRLWQNYG